jgi:hypothetical protein
MSRMASSGQRAIDDHGVPVPLVEVVSGKHRRVRAAQRLGELGLALEADPKRLRTELGEGKHPSGDLEHRGLGAEGKRLFGSREREAAIAQLGGIHRPDGDWPTTVRSGGSVRKRSSSGTEEPVGVHVPAPRVSAEDELDPKQAALDGSAVMSFPMIAQDLPQARGEAVRISW